MSSTVIVSGARTPIGKLLGTLSGFDAVDLGIHAVKGALERSPVEASQIEAVYLGNVVQAGNGPNVARLVSLGAQLPMSAHATTVNKLCLSGLAAVGHADLAIRGGMATTILAGGTESMTNAPHLAHVRAGAKYGAVSLADALDRDALICGIDRELVGAATDRYQRPLGISREEQDDFAARSHHLAALAMENGLFDEEISPVEVRTRAGVMTITADEGVRPKTTAEGLAALRPAFGPDGTITAGSASQISDGAAAAIVMDKAEAQRLGVPWMAEILAYASVAGPDPSLLLQPANAIRAALRRAGLGLEDIDLAEINEAFASVVIASVADLGLAPDRVNINGGAIALGHPVGMSGTRLVLTLANSLRRRGGGIGVVALCGGGGQGDAMVIRV